ncbi:MAG TPA: PEP-CTERM sorting domain-containing protein [Verrucomicrobiae bacterium]|nr:PEP-CTERM sorting domain-containing protein [Verrucomicrobiae bacterium]
MKIGNKSKSFAVGFSVLLFAVSSAMCGTIYQSGTSGTTYTDVLGDGQGSSNKGRDISYATIANDANNLYITIALSPTGNLETQGSFNYVMAITSGNPSAGGDTSASADFGNPWSRAISIDSSFGGMTDWIGAYGAGGSGSASSPFTSFGFNDWVYSGGSWTQIENVASGEPISMQPSTSTPNEFTLTVPLSDLSNLNLTPGSSFDFDIDSTGTSAGQTAYDSLVVQGPIQATYSGTAQFNETVLDQYTISSVPEPGTLALAGLSGLSLILFRRRQK